MPSQGGNIQFRRSSTGSRSAGSGRSRSPLKDFVSSHTASRKASIQSAKHLSFDLVEELKQEEDDEEEVIIVESDDNQLIINHRGDVKDLEEPIGHVHSPYKRIMWNLKHDSKWKQDEACGRIVGMYRIAKNFSIGNGNFSTCKLGVHQLTKERVAVKIIDKCKLDPKLMKMLPREISTLESVAHHNLIRLYEVIETETRVYLITEWACAGDLYTKVSIHERLTEPEAKLIFRQILNGVYYLHYNGICHRDLKAENIFFKTATEVKLGDFGFSIRVKKGELLRTFCGSPPYAAVELFRDACYEGQPVDAWACGVILFFMVEGYLPFTGNSIAAVKKSVLKGSYKIHPTVSDGCLKVIASLLNQNVQRRLTILQALNHPWLRRRQNTREKFSNVNNSSSNSTTTVQEPDVVPQNIDNTSTTTTESSSEELSSGLSGEDSTTNLHVEAKPINYSLELADTEIPTQDQVRLGLLTTPEAQALIWMQEIGIDEYTIQNHRLEGSRSPIVGIYRILLHRLQQGGSWTIDEFFVKSNLSNSRSLKLRQIPGSLFRLIKPNKSSSCPQTPQNTISKQTSQTSIAKDKDSVSAVVATRSSTCSIL